MAESRLPASPQGAAESGTEERDRSGMLPRPNGVEVKQVDEELVLLLAEQLHPNLTHIDQITDKQEKAWWTLVAGQVLRGHEAVTRYVEKFSEVFKPSVEVQVADTLRKGVAEELERHERKARDIEIHKVNLLLLAQQGFLELERWDMEKEERKEKLRLETEERETAYKNRDRREKLALGIAAITFACALVAFVIGWVSGEPWISGISSIPGVTALVALVKLMLAEQDQPPPVEGAD